MNIFSLAQTDVLKRDEWIFSHFHREKYVDAIYAAKNPSSLYIIAGDDQPEKLFGEDSEEKTSFPSVFLRS